MELCECAPKWSSGGIPPWTHVFLFLCVLLLCCWFCRYSGSSGGRDSSYGGGSRGYGGSSGGSSFGGGGYGGGRGGSSSLGERLRKPRWDVSTLPHFEKNFYREHPDIANRSQVSSGSFL